jgi:hypothetical protein
VRYVLAANDYEALHRRRAEDYIGAGTAVTQIVWDPSMDYGRGNIAVIRWPIEAFLWDPYAEDIQDSRAVLKVSWHPLSWFAAHYPDAAPWVDAEDGLHDNVGVTAAQETLDESGDEGKAMLIEYWYRLYDADKKRHSINVAYLAGGALLALSRDVFWHGLYPFVLDAYTTIEGFPVGDSMTQQLVPTMRYINKYARYIDTNLRMSSKGRMLISRSSGIDKGAMADWSQDIIEADRVDNESYQWLQHAPFTNMVSAQMVKLQTDLKFDSGQTQFQRGETIGGVTSASAISALQEAGSKVTRLHTATMNQGFKKICEHIMWLVWQFYDDNRRVMITGRMGQAREVDMSAKHLFGGKPTSKSFPAPPYTVQIQVSRRNPMRVQAQNELFMQAYTMAAEAKQVFPLSLLFQMLTVDGKDRIMPVIQQVDQVTQMIQQLQQQLQQAQMQNEQMAKQMENYQKVNAKYMEAFGAAPPEQEEPPPEAMQPAMMGAE